MKEGYKYTWEEIELLKKNWNSLSIEYFGKFRSIKTDDNISLRRFELKIPFIDNFIHLKTNEFKPLYIYYTFNKEFDFTFLIYPEDFTDKIGKLFGMKEVELGINEFDNRYFIKTGSSTTIKKILNDKLINFLNSYTISNFKLSKSKNTNVLEMNILMNEIDLKEMKKLINIFQIVINKLIELY